MALRTGSLRGHSIGRELSRVLITDDKPKNHRLKANIIGFMIDLFLSTFF